MKRILALLLWVLPITCSTVILAENGTSHGAYSQKAREYHLKAAFLRYVAKFVEWPKDSMQEGVINLCVIGQVPYFEGINSINGKIVNHRTIVVSKIREPEEAKEGRCQILFVAQTEEDNIEHIVSTLKDLPILKFGDMENFSGRGGDMNFYIANNRLAIMANMALVDKERMKVNPEMIRLITITPGSQTQTSAT